MTIMEPIFKLTPYLQMPFSMIYMYFTKELSQRQLKV